MDTVQGLGDERRMADALFGGCTAAVDDADEGGVSDALFDLGGDERRMHVRAYNHWVSLLNGQSFPAIVDLKPEDIADFGPHSVLLDFAGASDDPVIAFLGRELRKECDLDASIIRIADVPTRSLLSRLTDHYLQIIANQVPIGFEAEFVSSRGCTTLYRGILMPYSSDGRVIDFIYGVINWKEVADAAIQASIDSQLVNALRVGPAANVDTPVWADGPSGTFEPALPEVRGKESGANAVFEDREAAETLDEHLAFARNSAALFAAADVRGRTALYRALGRAHDFALAADEDEAGYAELLGAAGLKAQARAPMTPVVKLVFGADFDKTRLTEYAAVLSFARRESVASGALSDFLGGFAGGIKAVVAAERAARKPLLTKPSSPDFGARTVIAHVAFDAGARVGSTVLLVATATENGGLDIVAALADHDALAERVLRAAA